MDSKVIAQAVKILKQGGIILYPTEGVYGLGCDPFNEATVMRLLNIKQRSIDKGLILIAAAWNQVTNLMHDEGLIEIVSQQRKQTNQQPITWVFPAKKTTPKWLTGGFDSIALRVTTHPVVKEICELFEGAIVSTSVNLAEQEPITSLQQVDKTIMLSVDFVVPGHLGKLGKPSMICDARTKQVLRK